MKLNSDQKRIEKQIKKAILQGKIKSKEEEIRLIKELEELYQEQNNSH